MCGFLGQYSQLLSSKEVFLENLAIAKHRGPDQTGYWSEYFNLLEDRNFDLAQSELRIKLVKALIRDNSFLKARKVLKNIKNIENLKSQPFLISVFKV